MKKKVFGLLALVCTLVCSLFIVGCGEEPDPTPTPEETTYTVTFKNGDETVKTVTVDEGDALAAGDVPAAPAAEEGKFFDGWFAGNAEVSVGYTPTADVTANAAFTQGVSVTFKNGDETVKTVYVRPNTAVAEEDIPAAPVAEAGKFFDGWFVGNVNVNDTYLVEEDVTANAVFTQGVAVTFKNGSETITTVYVRPNAVLAEADIPADPTAETNFAFDAWVDGENNVVDLTEAAFEEDTEIFASFVRTAYTVTFVNGTDSTPVTVARGQDGFFLAAGDIPAAPAMESGHVFLGWYNAGVKAVGNLEITEDITFTAIDVCKADYVGTWVNDDSYAIIDDTTFSAVGYSSETYTYDAETGALKFSEGMGYSSEIITFMLVGDTLTLTYQYYDWTEELVTETYVLTKAAPFAYAGTYQSGSNELIIADGGIVSKHSSKVYEGRMYQEGENWFIKYKTSSSSSSFTTIPVTIDANGNIIITAASSSSKNGVFVKGVSDYESYQGTAWNDSTTRYLYEYILEDNSKQYVWRVDTAYYPATVAGEIADGNEVVLTLTGAPTATETLKIYVNVGSYSTTTKFYVRTNEYGTYTCAGQDNISLDGYGKMTVGSAAAVAYMVNAAGVSVVADEDYTTFTGYKFDLDAKTYTVETADGKAATYEQYDGSYTLILDGFGGVIMITSSGSVKPEGTYEFNQEGTQVVLDDTYTHSGTYDVLSANIFYREGYSSPYVYVKVGTEISVADDYVGSNNGAYALDGEYVILNVNAEKVTFGGTEYDMEETWGAMGICYTFTVDSTEYTITLGTEADTIVLSNGTDSKTYVSAAEVEIPADAFLGKWENASRNDFYFNGYGKGIMYTDSAEVAITYTINDAGNRINFTADSISYTVYPKSGAENTLSVMAGSYTDIYDVTYVAPDAFAGTWSNADKDNNNYYLFTITVNGYGSVTITSDQSPSDSDCNGTAKYTINSTNPNRIDFTIGDAEYQCVIDGTTMDVKGWWYGELYYTATLNLEVIEEGGVLI